MSESAGMRPETTVDGLLGGRLLLRQSAQGHRAGTDAVLLAAAAAPEQDSVAADIGAGIGTVGLALALRVASLTVQLVEVSDEAAALARENAVLNAVDSRVRISVLDVFDREARKPLAGRASLVITNPPFFADGTTRASPDPSRARAHVLVSPAGSGKHPHGAWLRACLDFLAPHGRLVMIHRPDVLPELLSLAEGRLGGLRVRPVQSHADRPAIRILLAGTVGSHAPFELLPPLVLHESDGSPTDTSARIHRGETLLPM